MNRDDEGNWHYTPAERAAVRLEWAEMRAYPCDYCGAASGEVCWNQASNAPFAHGPGHHSRIFRAATA